MKIKKESWIAIAIIFGVLLIDQVSKIWVKTHMHIGDEFHFLWGKGIIHFTENEGMAFGMSFGGEWGKLFLSLFRIVAISMLVWYMVKLIRERTATIGFVICWSMIIAGASGNMFDSAFYGLVFNDSYYQISSFMPAEGGYASFLHGRVVDMLYFPLLHGFWPDWVPFLGGDEYLFFRPVFNVADASITTGAASLLLFNRKIFKLNNESDSRSEDAQINPDANQSENSGQEVDNKD